MSTTIEIAPVEVRRSTRGEPTWEIASLFPPQGAWTEKEYLELDTNRLVEFDNGVVEVLDMPNSIHQAISKILLLILEAWTEGGNKGTVFYAPIKLRLWEGKYREPDLLFLLRENMSKYGIEYWTGADLVVEIVSSSGRLRDTVEKRAEYAKAGIPEYWIIDPTSESLTVLKLDNKSYVEHGIFKSGETASSHNLKGFDVPVSKLFAPVKR